MLNRVLEKFLFHINKRSQYNKFSRFTTLDSSVRILPEAIVRNLSNKRDLISIGSNSTIKGELLIFAHAGKIEIGRDCYLGENSKIWSSDLVSIGDRVLISHGVNIHDTNSHPIDAVLRHKHFMEIMSVGHPTQNPGIISKPVIIEDDVWIGFNAIVLKGVKIGRNVIVGAGSVVTKDIPSDSLIVGNPAKVIRKL